MNSSAVTIHVLGPQVAEVGVFQGILHRNAAGRVQLQHLHAQVQSRLVKVFEESLRVHSLEFGEGGLEIGQVV